MKWLSNKYAYPLVIIAIIVSVASQAAWLNQLFKSQRRQVKLDLEQVVGNAAKMSNYLSLRTGHEKSRNLKDFFLGQDWLQFKQAFSNMRFHHIGSRFNEDVRKDSTIVDISLRFANNSVSSGKHGQIQRWFDPGETLASVMKQDSVNIKCTDSLVKAGLKEAHLNVKYYRVLYNYDNDQPDNDYSLAAINKATFASQKYTYDLGFMHTYQLVATSITGAVIYRMRYYLISSVLMLVLTVVAFYLLFSLIKSQRLYAQARLSFTSNMTHELKTPVSVIEAALDAITRYDLVHQPEKLNNYIQASRGELQRLNLMIEKVLNLDKLDEGQLNLRKELYDAQQGLEQVVTSMQLQGKALGVEINYHPSEEPCFVNVDPLHLTNVFYNLMDNAIKYGGKGVRITVTCQCDENDVRISIQDNGPGIEKAYHHRIFDRFFRVQENSNVHNVKGSGLGLHYVKQIVAQNGGRIELSIEKGKGSNFVIHLPAYHEV